MQPLWKVCPNAYTTWGQPDTITSRPKVAVRIAECIAEWAEIETILGLFLGSLLNSDSRAALAMYSSVENRSSQRKMIIAAAEAKLNPQHFDVAAVVMNASIAPVMKTRDKLAHWCWGQTDSLPDDLLICPPKEKISDHFDAANSIRPASKESLKDKNFFVVTEEYLCRLAGQLREAKSDVLALAESVWERNSPSERAESLLKLSNKPQIHEGLLRLNSGRW